jgi:hypothetical protein
MRGSGFILESDSAIWNRRRGGRVPDDDAGEVEVLEAGQTQTYEFGVSSNSNVCASPSTFPRTHRPVRVTGGTHRSKGPRQ